MPLLTEPSDLRGRLQGELFPCLRRAWSARPRYQHLVTVAEMVPVYAYLPRWERGRGVQSVPAREIAAEPALTARTAQARAAAAPMAHYCTQ
jgi:hypothetical protein